MLKVPNPITKVGQVSIKKKGWCLLMKIYSSFFPSSQLTYGLTEKEITRKGGVANLVYNNSVKSKVKDYIRQYMKKFGPVYIRT